ncbi:hypothetical protein DFH29DRAFT_874872 [Suillus ampliporus]|nr:hypothetical protein DFH29DRAFT_874872 [Suillus ampliporus]
MDRVDYVNNSKNGQHLKDQLVELRLCLEALPTNIPVPLATESRYKFSDFSPDAEWTVDIGEAERGLETEAVVDVLETWIEKYPGDIILEKWVHDILEAAQGVILAAGKAVNEIYFARKFESLTRLDTVTEVFASVK